MKKLTRLIGGSRAGEAFMLDERLPTFQLPVRTKIGTICFGSDDLVEPTTVKLEMYAITRTNGEYNYGVLNAMEFHEALDNMWDAYNFHTRRK